jgi:hypothetical protein
MKGMQAQDQGVSRALTEHWIKRRFSPADHGQSLEVGKNTRLFWRRTGTFNELMALGIAYSLGAVLINTAEKAGNTAAVGTHWAQKSRIMCQGLYIRIHRRPIFEMLEGG